MAERNGLAIDMAEELFAKAPFLLRQAAHKALRVNKQILDSAQHLVFADGGVT